MAASIGIDHAVIPNLLSGNDDFVYNL